MKYVLDTHTIYWFFENPAKLTNKSLKILKDDSKELVIPSIVLAELKYIFRKYKMLDKFREIFINIVYNPRCHIIPLDENIVERMNTDLEIHDAIIVATAKSLKEIYKEEVVVISCDKKIIESKLIKVIW
jgi:PIN domain nuclease of toxin-antitoxin system